MLSIELTSWALSLVLALSTYPPRVKTVTPDHFTDLANSTRINSTGLKQALEITCNGEYFGHNPSISDCHSALSHIAPDHVQFLWGLRHRGLGDSVFPLPYRIMGGEFPPSARSSDLADRSVSTDRGLCFFQTLIPDQDVQIARASLYQVRKAANALILQCAANSDSRGGIAHNIGELL